MLCSTTSCFLRLFFYSPVFLIYISNTYDEMNNYEYNISSNYEQIMNKNTTKCKERL